MDELRQEVGKGMEIPRYLAHMDRKKYTWKELAEHLHQVSDSCSRAVPPTVEFPEVTHAMLVQIVREMGLIHDLGKYTDAFQQYLLEGIESVLKSHAHISALYTHCNAVRYFESCGMNQLNAYAWAFITYLGVRYHHGNLTTKGLFKDESIWNVLDQQAKHLEYKFDEIFTDLFQRAPYDSLFYHFQELHTLKPHEDIRKLKQQKRLFIDMGGYLGGRLRNGNWFFPLTYLFSILIDSDKLDSGNVRRQPVVSVSPSVVQNFILDKNIGNRNVQLDQRREQVRMKMLQVINDLSESELIKQRWFTITAPTGIGKTLASLQVALRLQERLKATLHYTPRIITAIPFINIIEGTADDYYAVFQEKAKILVHHRFTDLISSKSKDSKDFLEETPVEQRSLEIESWEADVVLTTFVQMFQSILTGKNKRLKKMNKLAGSIVILDEVQALPEEYMPLIGAVLRKFGEYYGTRFILMTATQPKVLELGDQLLGVPFREPVSLLRDSQVYFQMMKRTQFIPLLFDYKLDNARFLELFMEKRKQDQSALIVVNTIKRSVELFKLLGDKQRQGEIQPETQICYLSTNIIPNHRKQLIAKVKKMLKEHVPVILISTQTIEAGVDLDFDIGFRDLSPLTSLIQTAGRINREGKKGEYCPVYIVEFEKDNGLVYEPHHMNRTRKAVSRVVQEPDYPNMVEEYYKALMKEISFSESERFWQEGIERLDFELLEEFSLIREQGQIVDVFVEYDERATKLANAYEYVRKGKWPGDLLDELFAQDMFQRQTEPASGYVRKIVLKQLVTQISQYIVQVRWARFMKNRPHYFHERDGGVEADWFWIPRENLEDYYDVHTGFKDESGEAFIY